MKRVESPFEKLRSLTILGLMAMAVVAASTLASVARADAPTITIGGGAEISPTSDSPRLNVLLRVASTGIGSRVGGHHFVWAQIQGDVAFNPSDTGARIPFMNINFVPAQINTGDGVGGSKFQAFPGNLGADVRLDESMRIRVDVIGWEKDYLGPSHIRDNIMLVAKIAADAIGFKMVSHVSQLGMFTGFSLAAVNAEIGAIITQGQLKVRILFGLSADVNFGGNADGLAAIQSDIQAYNEVSLDVTRFVRIFVRNAINMAVDTGTDPGTINAYQLMFGATFIF